MTLPRAGVMNMNHQPRLLCTYYFRGWRDVSAIQVHWLFFLMAWVQFPPPISNSKPPLTPGPGDMTLFWPLRILHAQGTQILMKAKHHIHKIKINNPPIVFWTKNNKFTGETFVRLQEIIFSVTKALRTTPTWIVKGASTEQLSLSQ